MTEKIQSDKKSKIKEIIFAGIIYHLLILYLLINSWSFTFLIILTSLDLAGIVFICFKKRLTGVIINTECDNVILEFSNLLNFNTELKSILSGVEYSYKSEYYYFTEFRKTLRLFIKGKKVARIQQGRYGWTENLLDNLVKMLDKYKIERKFIGHTLKDMWPEKQ